MNIEYIREHFPFFSTIYIIDSQTKGVASTNLEHRTLTLNIDKLKCLSFEQIFFVICHEEGHSVMHTTDELLADKYAYSKYEKYNFSNEEPIKLLHQYLDLKNPINKARLWRQIQRSKYNDQNEVRFENY